MASRALRKGMAAAAGWALLACAAAPAVAALPQSPFMPVGEAVEPPYGYFDYCHRKAVSCREFGDAALQPADARSVGASYWDLVFQPATPEHLESRGLEWVTADLTVEQWREVDLINRRVNQEVGADSDENEYRKRDFWTLPKLRRGRMRGDCEDYVLEKRTELIAAGVPEGALSIAVAKSRRGEVHAVLLLATPTGEYVLDNRSAWISRWYDLNYRWERRQIPGSQAWVRVGGGYRPA